MPYKERLHPWILVRLLFKMQRLTVGHFRTRCDADGHLEILRRLIPNAKFLVMFKPDVLQPQLADTHYCNIRSVILNSIFTAHFEYLESQIDQATHLT